MGDKAHWEGVYSKKRPEEVSWFLESTTLSLDLIHQIGTKSDNSIIDVGGGASRLVDALLKEGFQNLNILDLSGAALKAAQDRIGMKANQVKWIEDDLTRIKLPKCSYDLWHDRAVFHFMTTIEQRTAYKKNLELSLRPHGHAIIATFAENGPEKCSGLPVQRYSVETLSEELGPQFRILKSLRESHQTPWGSTQEFIYCLFQRFS